MKVKGFGESERCWLNFVWEVGNWCGDESLYVELVFGSVRMMKLGWKGVEFRG